MEKKIPPIIHYCWLSDEEKPEKIQKCIDSWHAMMPDYEIMCWDMNRFDINSVPFVKTACEARKWAFAADYIRLYALYHYGGIYLDSDVFVYKSFDPFLVHSAFTGSQVNTAIFEAQIREGSNDCVGIEAAVIGAMPKHKWIKDLLSFYDGKTFENTPECRRKFVMTKVVADICAEKYNFKFMPLYQVLDEDVHVYPPDTFSIPTDERCVAKYSTHWCANSWVEHQDNHKYTLKEKVKIFIVHKLIGVNNWRKLTKS
ncbi:MULTISPECIES: glycosyltransferase family 32 protein [unclassified Dysgonomonas]|uniref:glycosyltransferase family 32 protein n=1 Tax=unclassified Dysgonomonas TaxID=2630389 RepID=UPI0024745A20|nr:MULTISPECIES: glycosyltransferase [unclassified Dysgonomonas]